MAEAKGLCLQNNLLCNYLCIYLCVLFFDIKIYRDKSKKNQIKNLMANNGKGMQVQQLDSRTFKVTFRTRISQQWIIISLNEDFPDSAPILRTDQKYSHNLIDNNGNIVGLIDLIKWNMHSDLSAVVNKCVHTFVAQPPSIKMSQQIHSHPPGQQYGMINNNINKAPPSYQQHLSMQQSSNNINNINNNKNNNNNEFDIGAMKLSIPNNIEQLNNLSIEQLNELNNEPKLLKEFAYQVASGVREMRQSTQNAVLNIANDNIQKHQKISKQKQDNDTIRTDIDTLTQLYDNLKKRQNKVLQVKSELINILYIIMIFKYNIYYFRNIVKIVSIKNLMD